MIFFPGGLLDRIASAYENMCVTNYYSFEKFKEGDVFAVQFLSSGNPLVTGLALRVRLKIGLFNEKKQRDKADQFLRATSRLIAEYGIPLIEYDAWADFEAKHPEFRASCEWDGEFLYLASSKYRDWLLTAMGKIKKN